MRAGRPAVPPRRGPDPGWERFPMRAGLSRRTNVSLIDSLLPASLMLPLTVLVAEMCVVTIGTLRIVFVSRGRRLLAPMLGFLEVAIWLFAVGTTMQNLGNPACTIAFATGFTVGNFLGLQLEKRLALGTVVIRIITGKNPVELLDQFHNAGYG